MLVIGQNGLGNQEIGLASLKLLCLPPGLYGFDPLLFSTTGAGRLFDAEFFDLTAIGTGILARLCNEE